MDPANDGRTAALHVDPAGPCPRNETMFQAFEWHCPEDARHWQRLSRAVPTLAALGATAMWIPPATKGGSGWRSNGYDAYDLYDLGEFDQKGTTSTKWGSKADLLALANVAVRHDVGLLFDAVLNHKAGADGTEAVMATRVDPKDRRKFVGQPEQITTWTDFGFPARNKAHSSFSWNHAHFTGVDYDHQTSRNAIWLFEGKSWAEDVDEELGNFDYLMFADIDHSNPKVRQEFFRWAEWLDGQVELGGLRLDAVKHFSRRFVRDLLAHVDEARARRLGDAAKPWFIVGEYLTDDCDQLTSYVEFMDHRISLFDYPLLYNFSRASYAVNVDLRALFTGALCDVKPKNAVTFVQNHDTQMGQTAETPISSWFMPAAYALILLRADAGLPCIFYADLYGSHGPSREHPTASPGAFVPPMCGGAVLPRLILARRLYAYGTQLDYFDSPSCVGFVRLGHKDHADGAGLAVLVNGGWRAASKRMFVGRGGQPWTDLLGWSWGEVVVDEQGWVMFHVGPRSLAVWGPRDAPGRDQVEDCTVFPLR